MNGELKNAESDVSEKNTLIKDLKSSKYITFIALKILTLILTLR